jgi:DNA-binding SARP family transcriptional activator
MMPVETSPEGSLDRCPNCGLPPRSLTVCTNCAYNLISRDVVAPWGHQKWEIVIRPDREYFDTLEHEGVEFPEERASRRVQLVGDHVSIGRRSRRLAINPEIDLSGALEDDGVSRRHAVLMRQPEGHWALIDQDSANGTLLGVDQDPIPANHPFLLSDGDTAYVGYWTKLSIERVEPDETPQLDAESRPSQDTRNIARRRRLFEIDLLGPLRVRVRGEDVSIGAPQVRAVLALLALRIGTPVSVADLEWALWGDDEPKAAKQAIQNHIKDLRKAIEDGAIETTQPSGYRLVGPKTSVDVFRFQAQCASGHSLLEAGHPGAAVAELIRALDLWQGEPLLDLADGPVGTTEIVSLTERKASAEDDLFQGRLELGGHHALVADLSKAVDAEPLRERRWEQLMLAQYRSGLEAEAHRTYQRLYEVLAEHGLEVSSHLAKLDRDMLVHSPHLQWTPPSEAGQTPPRVDQAKSEWEKASRPVRRG